MIEAHQTWNLVPNVDLQGYNAWAKKTVGIVLAQPGLLEFRGYRNLAGSPQVLTVTVWEDGGSWAKFVETGWPPLEAELRAFITNHHYALWGSSPLIPQPLRPAK
jgi:hypothetical protein